MKNLLVMALILFGISSRSQADANYGDSWKTASKISSDSFRSHFQVKGEIFILDGSGKKLLVPTTEIHDWHAGVKSAKLENTWSVSANGFREIVVHHVWELKDDNSILVNLKQYDHVNKADPKKPIFGKLIREESISLENFAPITWVAEETADIRVVLRFTPEFEAVRDVETLDKILIGGDRGTFTVTDNMGYLWGDNVRFGGVFVGMTSHRGSFAISLYPFAGAKALGFAMGKSIDLALAEGLNVKIKSETELIPGDLRVKVYGKYIPNLKSSGPSSNSSYGQSKLSGFPKEFGL